MFMRIGKVLVLAGSALSAGLVFASPTMEFKAHEFDYAAAHEKASNSVERLRAYRVVEDEEAATGKALQVAMNRHLVADESVCILSAPAFDISKPGTYRATVRMKVQGMMNTLGSGIRINARSFNSRTVYMNEFDEEDVYQEFELDFESREGDIVTRPKDEFLATARQRLNITNEQSVSALRAELDASPNNYLLHDKARQKALPFGENDIEQLNGIGRTPAQAVVSLSFPRWSRDSRGPSTPFPTLRRLTVDWVRVEKLPEPDAITIREVAAKYAWRRPGELQKFTVWLHNRSGSDKEADLRLSIGYGLDGRLVIGAKPVNIKQGGYLVVEWPWDVPNDHYRYGQEIRAEIVKNGEVLDAACSWFTVHPRVTAVLIPYGSYNNLQRTRYRHPYAPLPNVANYYEQWAPTPYDSAGLVPEDVNKPFASGNSGAFRTIGELRGVVKGMKDKGVFCAFYLEGHGTGCKSWDLMFDKPEQKAGAGFAVQTEEFYIKRKEVIEEVYPAFLSNKWSHPSFPGNPPEFPHTGFVMYNGLFSEPVDRVIMGAIEFSKLVGYDGIRWDSCLPFQAFNTDMFGRDYGKTQEELRQIQLDNFARFQKEVRAANPDFEWRMNGGISALMSKPDDPFDFAKAREIIENDFHKAFVADDAGIQEEGWGFSYVDFADYKNVCLNYLRAVRYESAAYKYAGGHHAHMHSHNKGMHYTPDDFYKQVFTLLGGAHMDSCNYGPLPDNDLDLGVYAARFGEFFWDPRLIQLERIEEKVSLDTDEDLWYTEAGFEKETERGTRIYVLPVINPPVTERWQQNRFGQLPAPMAEPVGVTVKIPEGYSKVVGVHLLDNSPIPECKALSFTEDKGFVAYKISGLHIFKVAVVEFQK